MSFEESRAAKAGRETAVRGSLCVAVLVGVLAGCGGSETPARESFLESEVTARLAAGADRVAIAAERGDDCAALRQAERLQRDAIGAVNAGQVPPDLQEELLAGVNRVASSLECVVAAPPPAASTEVEEEDEDDEEREGDEDDGKGKGKGKGKKKGKRK